MKPQLGDRFAALLDALHTIAPPAPTDEVILRADRSGDAQATLRVDGRPPRVFVRDGDGLRELLPAEDDGLPGARLLRDPDAVATALGSLGPIRDREVVAWRPGRRAVLRITTAAGETLWLKLLDRRGYARAARVFAALAPAPLPLQLCTPLLLLPSWCGYVAAPAAGVPLRRLLADGAAPPLTLLSRAVLALAFTPVHGALPRLDFETARAATVGMLEKGAAVQPHLAALAARLRAMPAPEPGPDGFVHGDLHDKQLFLDGERAASLIDLEGVACGDPRFDVANLAEHLRLRDLQQHGRDGGLGELLLARCNLDPDTAAARAFRTVVRARLCGVYALRPRWTDLVARLCNEVNDLLDQP